MNQANVSKDIYLEMREQGYEDIEIRGAIRPLLEEGGFSDQEISTYFKGYDPVSMMDALQYGFQGSVTGLAMREKLPDSLSPEQVGQLSTTQRVGLQVGTLAGDMPTMVVGAALGLLGGPSAPVTVPASAMAITEGTRAIYVEHIKNGDVQNAEQFTQRMGTVLAEAGKGGVIGGVTGGMGKLASIGAKAAGAGVVTTGAATVTAEVATMPTVAAGLEGRLPEPQEFVDAAILVAGLKGASVAGGKTIKAGSELVPKLRDIYAKTGKIPEEVALAAQNDPTVRQDVLAVNRPVPEAFATDILNRAKQGENVSVAELEGYREQSWAQALINEHAGPEAIKAEVGALVEKARQGNVSDKTAWGFVRQGEANAISSGAEISVAPGYSHIIDGSAVRHTLKSHGDAKAEAQRGQLPITEADFQHIPEVVLRHDSITNGGKNGVGRDVVRYEKNIGEDIVFVVEEVRTKRNQLAFQSMWKRKATGSDSHPPPTSETFMGMSLASDAANRASGDGLSIVSPGNKVNHGTLQHTGGATRVPVSRDKPVLPESALNHADTMPLSGVVQALADALDVPIRTGKMGLSGKNAEGTYQTLPEIIRTRTSNDIATIVHEAGHHIQKQLFGDISASPLRSFGYELKKIATKPRNGQSPLPEGFAEFVSKYVINPQEAQKITPRFFRHFEALLSDRAPEFKTALLNAREAVKRWADQPTAQEVLSHINIEGRQSEGFVARLLSKDSWDRLYTNFIDRLYPLKKATELLANGEELPADMNPYTMARTFAGAKGKATHFIERSPFKFGTWENVGKPLAETLRAVENIDEFRAYLVSRRGIELEGRGIKAGPRPAAMRATLEKLEEKYGSLARELDDYQNHVTNYIVDSGMLNADTAAAMREMNQSYVPFFRVMENDGGFFGGGKSLQGRNPIQRIKGSGRDIIDPLESIIKNTYAMIEAAEKNAIGRALTDLASRADGSGWLVEKLPAPKVAIRVSGEDVSRAFINSLGPIDKATRQTVKSLAKNGELGEMVTFWQNAVTLDKKSQIAVFRDGKREVYQVAPEVAEVMNGLNVETIPLLAKLVSIPAKMLRAGATLTPDFMVRNLIRDAVTTGAVSRTGFTPGLDTARGLKRAITKGDTYWNWVKAGGDQASLVSMDRTTLQATLKDITATGYPERVWNVVKNPIELLRLGSELSEKMTRLGEFGKAVDKHGTDKDGLMQAAYESRDIMDFARRGKLTSSFNMITAFFNASVQGLDRTVRGAIENPKRFLVRTALFIGIPSILNAIRNYGDDDVTEVPRAQRDMFWIVPVGQGDGKFLLRIPKPFEQGVAFGSSLERATEFILDAATNKYGSIEKAREKAFRGLGASMVDVAAPNLVPTAFAPLVEHFANRSLPFDRPIVPKSREDLLPEYQYAPYTTELMKSLSHMVGTLPSVGEMDTFSPARAENYIRSWTGGLGMYALQGFDAMARKAGVIPDPVKPTATLADIPFVRAFVIRHPSMGAESVQRFFDNYDKASSYLKTINALGKEYKYDEVSGLLPYHAYQALEGPRKALAEITSAIDLINKMPGMTSDEKRQNIDSLYYQAINVARYGNQAFEALQPDIEKLQERAEKTNVLFGVQGMR